MPIDRFHHAGRTRPTPRWRQLHRRRRTRVPRTRPSRPRWLRPTVLATGLSPHTDASRLPRSPSRNSPPPTRRPPPPRRR